MSWMGVRYRCGVKYTDSGSTIDTLASSTFLLSCARYTLHFVILFRPAKALELVRVSIGRAVRSGEMRCSFRRANWLGMWECYGVS
jgi:hypothetical protein